MEVYQKDRDSNRTQPSQNNSLMGVTISLDINEHVRSQEEYNFVNTDFVARRSTNVQFSVLIFSSSVETLAILACNSEGNYVLSELHE